MDYAIDFAVGVPTDVIVDQGGEKVYLKFTATTSGKYTITLDGGDTILYFYKSPTSSYSDWSIYATYDSGYTHAEKNGVSLEAGATYYIVVKFYYSSDTGELVLNVQPE